MTNPRAFKRLANEQPHTGDRVHNDEQGNHDGREVVNFEHCLLRQIHLAFQKIDLLLNDSLATADVVQAGDLEVVEVGDGVQCAQSGKG